MEQSNMLLPQVVYNNIEGCASHSAPVEVKKLPDYWQLAILRLFLQI